MFSDDASTLSTSSSSNEAQPRSGISSPTIEPDSYFTKHRLSNLVLSAGITDHTRADSSEMAFSLQILGSHPFFSKLSKEIQYKLCENAVRLAIKRNVEIIAPGLQNSLNECMMIVRSGGVLIKTFDAPEKTRVVDSGGGIFNEEVLSCVPSKIKYASAQGQTVLLAIHWQTFQQVLAHFGNAANQRTSSVIKSVPFLDFLSEHEYMVLSDSLERCEHPSHSIIAQFGAPASRLFLIEHGDVVVRDGHTNECVCTLRAGNYFSEYPLTTCDSNIAPVCSATFVTATPALLYAIRYQSLYEILGAERFNGVRARIQMIWGPQPQ